MVIVKWSIGPRFFRRDAIGKLPDAFSINVIEFHENEQPSQEVKALDLNKDGVLDGDELQLS